MKEGLCSLCHRIRNLNNSHIIPNFIHKWQKNTSFTGNVRSSENFNKICQGGFKDYLLCNDCENRFSKLEKYFSDVFFYPFINESKLNNYDIRLSKYIISLSWRSLIKLKKNGSFNSYNNDTIKKIDEYELIWRNYLLSNLETFPNNIFHNAFIFNENMYEHPYYNRYIRNVAIDFIVDLEAGTYFYIKLPYFSFICFLDEYNEKYWKNSEVKKEGNFYSEINYIHKSLSDVIYEHCEYGRNLIDEYSTKQFLKVQKRFNNIKYDTHAFEMTVKDYLKYGDNCLPKRK